jgi:hypothetical protein
MMKRILITLLMTLISVMASEQSVENEVGRYQVSTTVLTTLAHKSGLVLVTVIDTKTGKIVRQETYKASEDYMKK